MHKWIHIAFYRCFGECKTRFSCYKECGFYAVRPGKWEGAPGSIYIDLPDDYSVTVHGTQDESQRGVFLEFYRDTQCEVESLVLLCTRLNPDLVRHLRTFIW